MRIEVHLATVLNTIQVSAHGADGGLGNDDCPGVQLSSLYAGQGAHWDRHRRLLVYVGRNGHSPGAATSGPPRIGHL